MSKAEVSISICPNFVTTCIFNSLVKCPLLTQNLIIYLQVFGDCTVWLVFLWLFLVSLSLVATLGSKAKYPTLSARNSICGLPFSFWYVYFCNMLSKIASFLYKYVHEVLSTNFSILIVEWSDEVYLIFQQHFINK